MIFLSGNALSLLGDKATIESTIEYIENHNKRHVGEVADDNNASNGSLKLRGHEDNESEVKPEDQTVPTEEEIEKKRLAAEEKIKQRRKEREAKAKEEELQREIKRREEGKGIGKMKAELEQMQRAKIAEEMRREKAEAKAARDAVLAQIARDREEQKRARQQLSAPVQPSTPVVTPLSQTSSAAKDGKCRLAIRLLDGTQLVNEFDGRESLSAVRVFVITKTSPEINFTFVMPPQPPFTEDDMQKPLTALGLCPSARIHVIRR